MTLSNQEILLFLVEQEAYCPEDRGLLDEEERRRLNEEILPTLQKEVEVAKRNQQNPEEILEENRRLRASRDLFKEVNSQLRQLVGVHQAATPSEIAVLVYLAKRITLSGESLHALPELRLALASPPDSFTEEAALKRLYQHAKRWASQGHRSRWNTEPSLALYDCVKAIEKRESEG